MGTTHAFETDCLFLLDFLVIDPEQLPIRSDLRKADVLGQDVRFYVWR